MGKRLLAENHPDVMMCAYTIVRQEFQYRSREHSIEFTHDYASHAQEPSASSAKLSAFRICVGSASDHKTEWEVTHAPMECLGGTAPRLTLASAVQGWVCPSKDVESHLITCESMKDIPHLRGQPLAKVEQQQSRRKPLREGTESQPLFIELKRQSPFPSIAGLYDTA